MAVVSQEWTPPRAPAPGLAAELLTVPVLQAALEVGRQGREWLEQRLAERRVEQEDLHGELTRLRDALLARDSAVTALGEQATVAAAQTAQLAEQVSVIGQERDRLARLLEEASAKFAGIVRERDTLSIELEALRGQAVSATAEIEALRLQVTSATAEIEGLRSHVSTAATAANGVAPAKPSATCALRPSDVRELGRTLELIAKAVGAMQTWTQEAAASDRGSKRAVAALAERLDTLLAPLAMLPELHVEVEGLGQHVEGLGHHLDERFDALSAGVEAIAPAEVESSQLGEIKQAIAEVGAGLAGLHHDLSDLSHFQRAPGREAPAPVAAAS